MQRLWLIWWSWTACENTVKHAWMNSVLQHLLIKVTVLSLLIFVNEIMHWIFFMLGSWVKGLGFYGDCILDAQNNYLFYWIGNFIAWCFISAARGRPLTRIAMTHKRVMKRRSNKQRRMKNLLTGDMWPLCEVPDQSEW